MVTGSTRGAPVHPLAWAGIVTAVLAGVLALYGSMYAEKHIVGSPLRAARGEAVAPAGSIDRRILTLTGASKIANYSLQIVAFVLPFVLGLAAAQTGGAAMSAVERSGGRFVGNTLAVFSMLVGGLAAVVAGCMMVSLYLWPRLPVLYTM